MKIVMIACLCLLFVSGSAFADPIIVQISGIVSYATLGPSPFFAPVGFSTAIGDSISGFAEYDLHEAPTVPGGQVATYAVQSFEMQVGSQLLVATNPFIRTVFDNASDGAYTELLGDINVGGVHGIMGIISFFRESDLGCTLASIPFCPGGPLLPDLAGARIPGIFQIHSDPSATIGFDPTNISNIGEAFYLNANNMQLGSQLAPVPEPGTLTLLGIGCFGLILLRRRLN